MWASASFSTLLCELERTPNGAVLWVTLNRPQAFNALSAECLQGSDGSRDSKGLSVRQLPACWGPPAWLRHLPGWPERCDAPP